MRSFLGLASYYRKFILNFSAVAAPLTELTKKIYLKNFNWTEEAEEAFVTLKSRLLSPPILVFPDYAKKFRVSTDASCVGLGAILSQLDDNDNDKVVAYASRSLLPAEKNYHTTERELLAVVWALDRFRPYIYNTEFDLITDHEPLVRISELNTASSRLVRWKLKLQEYSFKWIHKPGRLHVNADVLSRVEHIVSSIKIIDEGCDFTNSEIIDAQYNDQEIKQFIDLVKENEGEFNNMVTRNGILYMKKLIIKSYEPQGPLRLVIPRSMIGAVLKTCHDDFCGSHMGINKTWWKISHKYWWPRMRKDMDDWIESCEVCASIKNPASSRPALGAIIHPEIPFDMIGIDILGPLTTTDDGNKYILVVTDYATRWVEAFPLKDQKAVTIARVLLNEIICRHSAPKTILSDQGRNFLSEVVKELCDYFQSQKINTTAYNPKCNGLTERQNSTICKMLASYCDEKQSDWDIYIPLVLFAYRTSWQKTVKEMPFRLLYGRDPRLPTNIDMASKITIFTENLNEAWKQARALIEIEAEKSLKRMEKKFPTAPIYKSGDFIRIYEPATKVGLKKKLRSDLWQGPFKVLDVGNYNITIDRMGKRYVVNLDRVKPAEKSRYGRTYKPVNRFGIT